MENTVVVYKSKYGTTKKYAQWLAQELSCDLYDASEIKADKLEQYGCIVFGGGLYASGICGVSLLTKNFEKLKGKTIAVFTVGLADPNRKEQFSAVLEKNFTEEMRREMHIFHLRGGINYKKLRFVHKAMMAMLIKIVGKKPQSERTEEENEMLDTYGGTVDFTDRSSIEPIISFMKENCKKVQ